MKLEVKNLSCQKGERYIFRNITFMLQPQQLMWIQGANGSGKTSLLKLIAGLGVPAKGQILWSDPASLSFLGHRDGLKPNLTAFENIKHQTTLFEQPCLPQDIEGMLNTWGLSLFLNRPCSTMSQGQRRKVGICTLLLKQKPLWILDEPFTALDHDSILRLQEHMIAHLSAGGLIIMASHTPLTKIVPHQIISLTGGGALCLKD
jgi:heme exporter protein A